VTLVHARPERDTLPPIDPTVWREVERIEHPAAPGDEAAFTILGYCRLPREGASTDGLR